MNERTDKPMLKLLMIITDWNKIAKIKDVFASSSVHFSYLTKAEGTASSEILDMFGLARSEKVVAVCIAAQQTVQDLMQKTGDMILMGKKGTGIAFTIPLTGAAANIIKVVNEEAQEMLLDYMNKIESEVEKMKSEATISLIVSVINQGYSEDLMEAAKGAGASGGTVINARRLGGAEKNFLGFSVQEEKEMVFILARREKKLNIMKAIIQCCGPESEAQGITVALPVDDAVGMRLNQAF